MYTISGFLKDEDWEKIRVWRNAQMDILRQDHEITPEEQRAYVKKYCSECLSYNPPQILYGFFISGPSEIRSGRVTHLEALEDMAPKLIGYGALVNMDWDTKVAELSYLVDPERKKDLLKYTAEWLTFLTMLRDVTAKLGLKRWRSETYVDTKDPTRRVHIDTIHCLFARDDRRYSMVSRIKNRRTVAIQEWDIA